jgi:hypothetical protein
MNITRRHITVVCLASILLIACGRFVASANDSTATRPMTAGVALAIPKSSAISVSSEILLDYSYGVIVPVDLRVTADGVVRDFTLVHAIDSSFKSLVDSALRNVVFLAGSNEGGSTEQTIPVRLHLRPRTKNIVLECPVNEQGEVGLAADYADALSLNGISAPKVSQLGSYMYPNHLQESPQYLPSILAKLTVSKSGQPRDVEIVHSTFPSLNEQIRSLLNWAIFDMAPHKEKSAPLADFYAAVVFHPVAQYPTPKVIGPESRSLRSPRSFLFQLLPDTLGLMVPPLPKRLVCDSVSVAIADKKLFGRVLVTLSIDTLGQITIEQMSRRERPVTAAVHAAIAQMSFYPALDFAGHPSEFRGLAYLNFEGSTNVRVHVDWLQDRFGERVR